MCMPHSRAMIDPRNDLCSERKISAADGENQVFSV